MNSHADIRRRLAAYSGGELDLSERKLVEMHLATCAACRAELADMKSTLHLIRSTPEVEPPPWLTSRIMAHLREEKSENRNWLQRVWLPLHRTFPVQILALLVVCVSGYYLSRTVETELKQTTQQQLQDMPAQPAPAASSAPVQESAKRTKQESPASAPPQEKAAPAPQTDRRLEAPPVQSTPQPPPAPAPTTYAPAPPAYKDQLGGKAESMKAAPAAESSNHIQETAPQKKAKSSRSLERMSDTATPAGRAVGAPAGIQSPLFIIRLTLNNPTDTPAQIRDAVSRSGGSITEDQSSSLHRIKARISPDRQNELLERLQRLGRIMERPSAPPTGAQLLELTIQW